VEAASAREEKIANIENQFHAGCLMNLSVNHILDTA
jgi:hypothetical protein